MHVICHTRLVDKGHALLQQFAITGSFRKLCRLLWEFGNVRNEVLSEVTLYSSGAKLLELIQIPRSPVAHVVEGTALLALPT